MGGQGRNGNAQNAQKHSISSLDLPGISSLTTPTPKRNARCVFVKLKLFSAIRDPTSPVSRCLDMRDRFEKSSRLTISHVEFSHQPGTAHLWHLLPGVS